MIPIKDTVRSNSFPIVNWMLVLLNVLVFIFETQLSPAGLDHFISTYALIPAAVSLRDPLTWGTIFTSMFIHSGWFHILSNMWVLIIFGDNVEDRIGSMRYLVYYMLSGLVAGLLQVVVDPTSTIPTIGASGAIAGVMGGYFSFFPTARILTLIPIFIFPWMVEIPAVIYLGFWFISQLYSGLLNLGVQSAGGVAWWAHVGGFCFGLVASRLFALRKKPSTWYPDQYRPW
jgi:membrane associated rhomboid family serine protease